MECMDWIYFSNVSSLFVLRQEADISEAILCLFLFLPLICRHIIFNGIHKGNDQENTEPPMIMNDSIEAINQSVIDGLR